MENQNIITCKDCLWHGNGCEKEKVCEHIHFISDEHFEEDVLPRLRASVVPRKEKRLSRKSYREPGVIYDDTAFDYYYVQMINDCLSEIRHKNTYYLYNVDQVKTVLSFEPSANVLLHDGTFYINL